MKALIFDLDGTLIDSLADIAESINRMLDARNYPRCAPELFKEMVGDGMEKLVERALPPEARAADLIKICTEEYRAHYDQLWNQQTQPYEGIPALLQTLRQSGLKLGVISNKSHRFTVPMTEHFFGKECFDAILGQRDNVPRKPAPDGGLEMIAALGLSPADCAYVGDSGIDMSFAKATDMKAIGVLWGFRSEQELRAAGADHLVVSPDQILALI